VSSFPPIPSLIRSCVRKFGYKTFAKAEAVRVKCMDERPGTRLRAYLCSYCARWHLTSQPTMVEKIEQEQAAAAPAPVRPPAPPKVSGAMIDVTCKHCRHRFGFRNSPELPHVDCPRCR
jgi:hypothetical protein